MGNLRQRLHRFAASALPPLAAIVGERDRLKKELADFANAQTPSAPEAPNALVAERDALAAQLKGVGHENRDLRIENDKLREMHAEAAHKLGVSDTNVRYWRYMATRYEWRSLALSEELFGPPSKCSAPPKTIPADLLDRFTMSGKVEIEYNYLDLTCPDNHPLIYTDREIDAYLERIRKNLGSPREKRDWFVYGTLDEWVCDAIEKYPIHEKFVVNMGSLTPWYEAVFIHFGTKPTTIDYNPIITRTNRMNFMTIAEWERERPVFDIGFSISSFEHDGLGMYGDPIDPDGDLKAMQKMKERIKPGGLLFLAVPTGRDKILFNNARIYGKHRLPLLMEGWEWIDSFGYSVSDLDGNGSAQPLYVLRNS
jgi:hypothetical protein